MESGRIEGGARWQRRDEGNDKNYGEPAPLTTLAGQRTSGIGERRRSEWGCGARLRESIELTGEEDKVKSGDTQDRLQREAALLKTVVADFYNKIWIESICDADTGDRMKIYAF
uniref:Uncharacterized protein n=1 Tax=Oryza barthii TaxID=65489 RepID=A0A0D3HSX2_9ORYZ